MKDSRMTKQFDVDVDESGRLPLPPAVAEKYGLKPGSSVRLEDNANGLHLRRPLTQLARIYIEPTSRCNLNCVTCIRNSWDERLGEMSSAVFSRIIDGLRAFSAPPSVFLGGIGEPLSHPHIVDMVKKLKSLGSFVELITNGTLLRKDVSKQLIDAGLDMLWVSLDGATPESYTDVRLGAALPEVIKNLRDFRLARWTKHYPTGLDLLLQPQLGIVYERSLKRHAVGNVLEQSIGAIWNKPEYLTFRRRIQEFDFSPCVLCGGCEFFESNQEDCIGSSIPACGGCLWAQGIIQCP